MGRHRDQGPELHARPNGTAEPKAGRGASTATETRTINLALQGGGAHGAFAWGVLDKLMEDGRIEIEGISATSAGAMNATVLDANYNSSQQYAVAVADSPAITTRSPSSLHHRSPPRGESWRLCSSARPNCPAQ